MLSSTAKPKDRYFFTEITNPIVESKIISDIKNDTTDKLICTTVFQDCKGPNANGHSFSKKVLTEAVEKLQPELADRHMLGELSHPDQLDDLNRISTIALDRASHVITKLAMDGDYVVGEFETLGTPMGLIASTLLREKCKLGVSVRAITDQDISYGMNEINEITDFTIITYDIVHSPAYSSCYIAGIKEGSISASKSYGDYLNSIISSCYRISDNKYAAKEPDNNSITLTKKELTELIEASLKVGYKSKLF